MSRVGGSPIKIPSGVTLSLVDGIVSAKGAKGELSKALPPMVELNISDEEAMVAPLGKTIKARAMWGTARAMSTIFVHAASTGFRLHKSIHRVYNRAVVQVNKIPLKQG